MIQEFRNYIGKNNGNQAVCQSNFYLRFSIILGTYGTSKGKKNQNSAFCVNHYCYFF